jgi:hypothetical protein
VRLVLLVALGTLAVSMCQLASSIGSTTCPGEPPAVNLEISPTNDPSLTFYLTARSDDSVWLYQEANGIAGLQVGGSSMFIPGDTDPCSVQWPTPPDSLLI